jgi:ferredoxin
LLIYKLSHNQRALLAEKWKTVVLVYKYIQCCIVCHEGHSPSSQFLGGKTPLIFVVNRAFTKNIINLRDFLIKMKVTVDKEKCIGCGSCVAICPSVFKLKNGKSTVKKPEGAPCAKEAKDACPVDAIKVKE